jgi:hypothetical protein
MGIEWDGMKIGQTVVILLACGFSLDAQITATLHKFPARSSELEIRNSSTVSLGAFAVSMAAAPQNENSAPFTFYQDTAVDETATPLLPNETYSIPVTSGKRPGHPWEDLFQAPIATAGIYTDGTTTGDADLLQVLIWRRCNTLQAVDTAFEILTDAGKHNVPRRELIGHFQRMANSMNRWYATPEQGGGRAVYQAITGKLVNLPDGPPGSAFPPTNFVEQESGRLNRRRVLLLESRPDLATAAAVGR